MDQIKLEYLPTLANDAVVVNSARASFADFSTWGEIPKDYDKDPAKLINYLAREMHTTPFRHAHFTFSFEGNPPFDMWNLTQYERAGMVTHHDYGEDWLVQTSFLGWVNLLKSGKIQVPFIGKLLRTLIKLMPLSSAAFKLDESKFTDFTECNFCELVDPLTLDPKFHLATIRVKAPCFLARQLAKHQVNLSWNEESRRYITKDPEFYIPEEWRSKPEGSIKQGSGTSTVDTCRMYNTGAGASIEGVYTAYIDDVEDLYSSLLEANVAPEMARMVLPQSQLFTWVWSGSLESFAKCYKERIASGAQKEAQYFAQQLNTVMSKNHMGKWAELIK